MRSMSIRKDFISVLKSLLLLNTALLLALFPPSVEANGASGNAGVYGNELLITESKPFSNLTVDEVVIIDGKDNTVDVTYSILNDSTASRVFLMAFPVEKDCKHQLLPDDPKERQEELEKRIEFNVTLNKADVDVEYVEPDNIKLEGEYRT